MTHQITQLRFNQAMTRAYTAFAHRHPEWVAALFDKHFLEYTAAPMFATYCQSGELPPVHTVARLWANQLPTIAREQRITAASAAAHDFLILLNTELCALPPHRFTRAAPPQTEWTGKYAPDLTLSKF
jgi:hypothetical protein